MNRIEDGVSSAPSEAAESSASCVLRLLLSSAASVADDNRRRKHHDALLPVYSNGHEMVLWVATERSRGRFLGNTVALNATLRVKESSR
mmetsp:Transcript_14358/g.36692  ORF Transcript_14358/g.36692 Transcript_14358/m.36692 type:complete len:89 (-) Transcript_14358:166-432(-)